MRKFAIHNLARRFPDDPDTLEILKEYAQSNNDKKLQILAINELVRGWINDTNIRVLILKLRVKLEKNATERKIAIQEFAKVCQNEAELFQFLYYCAINDPFDIYDELDTDNPRKIALDIIVQNYSHHPQTLQLLRNRIANDPDPEVHYFARKQLRKLNQK